MSDMPHPVRSPSLAALAVDLAPLDDGAMLLIPAGEFRSRDGRPGDVRCWRLTADGAQSIIRDRQAAATAIVIDWEHATLKRAKDGGEAPAAGWIDPMYLEWRDGVGLVALRRDWTPRAAAQIETQEYRYGSPVFRYDPITGDVLSLHSFALTNDPGLDGLGVALSALTPDPLTQEDTSVDELIEQLRWLLNLPVGATVDDIKVQLQKIIEQLGTSPTAAASFDLRGHLATLSAQASAGPDLAKWVPVDTHRAVVGQLAALQADSRDRALEETVRGALESGRLLAAQEQWARDLGRSNLAALTQYLDTVQPVAALQGMQTGGGAPRSAPLAALTAEEVGVCRALGLSEDAYAKTKGEPQ